MERVEARFQNLGVRAIGALAVATAVAGVLTAAGADDMTQQNLASWCTIYPYEVYVDDTTIATTPQIGPVWCPP